MSTPANIASELSFLQAQIAAAEPLNQASKPTIQAMRLNAHILVTDLDLALTNAAGQLDTWQSSMNPEMMISGFETLVINSEDQASLALMRGLVGRVAASLDRVT